MAVHVRDKQNGKRIDLKHLEQERSSRGENSCERKQELNLYSRKEKDSLY